MYKVSLAIRGVHRPSQCACSLSRRLCSLTQRAEIENVRNVSIVVQSVHVCSLSRRTCIGLRNRARGSVQGISSNSSIHSAEPSVHAALVVAYAA